jgi:RNA polymerase sigma factor (sigma-70 family)
MQTEMTGSANENAQQDEAAVAAVRGGDAERYRELVERHERRVYAVAWSRLGDAALAEEVTQEAFIRAFRRLSLLGDGAKFAAWVNTIARRIAINFGLRHRRELNKRDRWALENPEVFTPENATDENDPPYTPETLRQTLSELPGGHRECLVLFYLEGKSGSEAAAALGISEAALRVRLHRARGAMRERLEEKLEGSLAKLRPAKTLVPAVMAGVLASSSAKAATTAGVGATLAGALAKLGFTKWLLPFASFFSFLFFLPMLLVSWLFARMELKNFRDQKGFRARLFRAGINRRIFIVFVGMIAVGVVMPLLLSHLPVIPSHAFSGSGLRLVFLLLAVFTFALLPFVARQLAINRNPYLIAQVCGSLGTAIVFLLVGLSFWPVSMVFVFVLGQSLLTLPFFGQRPVRMDYNLFLRASEGLLKNNTAESPRAQGPARRGKSELLAFARFLGSRWLVSNYRWVEDGLLLRLPLTGASPWWTWTDWTFNRSWKRRSSIQLEWDAKVSAQLCETDQKALSRFHGNTAISKPGLETQVADAVAVAWRNHRESNVGTAELALGQQSETEVFVVPPGRGGIAKVRWLMAILLALILVSYSGIKLPGVRERLDGLKAVNISEAQVRAFLNDTTPNPDPKKFKFNSPDLALFTCLVLPPTNLFSPEGLRMMRDEVAGNSGFESVKEQDRRAQWVFGVPLARRAVADGWISWNDLGIEPADSAAFLRTSRFPTYSLENWDYFLARCEAWSWVERQRFNVMRIQSDGVTQLRLLRAVNCLDLTDREKLIQQVGSVQVLSGTPPGQPPMHDWKDIRGLFFTPCFPALQDTYFSLAALEILGGLDKIDREACIQGILRRHQGKGFFTSPDSGGFNEYHIDGSARDTIAAFESLRILGGLERVKDLDEWQFRPQRRGVPRNQLTWGDVEAWVCQQRFTQIISERKDNPRKPFGSLLDTHGL